MSVKHLCRFSFWVVTSILFAALSGCGLASDGYMAADSGWVPNYTADENEGDKYEDVGTNPFVYAVHDPFSTFAVDVDSASYDIFRRDIDNGMLPVPESVRLEEYVNYFRYDYSMPSEQDAHPFSVTLTGAPYIFENGTSLLRVGIQGEFPAGWDTKPVNLVFLIDTSGSMSGEEKLPLVHHLLRSTVDLLGQGDTISIVSYAGSTELRLEPTDASEREAILQEIDELSSGGSTAGAAGIDLAYQQAEAGFIEGGINHVILCTDGDFNVGPASDEELVSLIEDKRESGVTLTVLGFGVGNLNDSMMEKVSNAGNGNYAVISSISRAESYVEKRMLSNLGVIAKDVKVQVEFNPQEILAYRLLGYENRAIADDQFRDDRVDGGEIGAGHQVTALYEVVFAGGDVPLADGAPEPTNGEPVDGEREISSADMMLVKVRYKEPEATQDDPAREVQASIARDQMRQSYNDAGDDFKWAAAVAAFAEILKDSPFADSNKLAEIEAIVTAKSWTDIDRTEFVELFNKAKELLP